MSNNNPTHSIETDQKVLKIVQELLQGSSSEELITPSKIDDNITLVLKLNPVWESVIDRNWIITELIRRFSVWVSNDTTLSNTVGHEPWLDTPRKSDWRYWQRYKEFQQSRLPWDAVDALDKSTDHILGLLEDPLRTGCWDRRGMVVGHVQSGKTGNYTGLICKAADAGYKIIVVLAGMHNNLRSQTQMRLDEGFLGYETNVFQDQVNPIGVGLIDKDPSIKPNFATNRSEAGDFNLKISRIGITPEQRPWLFVVKKNKSVLTRLYKWIADMVANATEPETGRRIVTNLPLLIIDDEADNASVDTGEQIFDGDGAPDQEHQPTAINRLIRKILHTFSRKAYVGYTATPFANIFIHERGSTAEEGPDLFPSAFIINLGAPSDYIGPVKVFGTAGVDGRDGGLPLIRKVKDYCSEDQKSGWMPHGHKSSHRPGHASEDNLPPSLCEAIDAFLLACANRKIRGQDREHSSMLIHVTRYNNVQQQIHIDVDNYIKKMRQRLSRRIGHAEVLERLHELWSRDFKKTSYYVLERLEQQAPAEEQQWQELEAAIIEILEEISVRMINGTAKDALDYNDSPSGLKVIAIGGDKLARGLTLEGLCVSYFLRASRMYDTLMQMGRWFGYRHGYLDLCRLYTTNDLVEWFEHITDASEELREEFDSMVDSGGTPRDYGLKVKSHPSLMITSRLKMRTAKSLYLSFSGDIVETVALYRNKNILKQNYDTFRSLVAKLGIPSEIPERIRRDSIEKGNGAMWQRTSYEHIVDFLRHYTSHPDAKKAVSKLLADFIEVMVQEGELKYWNIAVVGGGVSKIQEDVGGISVPRTKRKGKDSQDRDKYSIGRLLSPRDEAIDLDEATWHAALQDTINTWNKDPARAVSAAQSEPAQEQPGIPSGKSLRKVRGFGAEGVPGAPDTGLLLIYLLDPKSAEIEFSEDDPVIVSFAISFPGSNSGAKVEYKVNNVMWEMEYGSAE